MNATARDFNSQPADINGLDDIFICEPVPTSADGCPAPVPTDADLCLEPVRTCAEPVQSDKHLEVIEVLQSKIEILTYRNGYLEAQLENQREQIKLLTDSQHKPSVWTNFASWFMGRR